MDQTQWDWLKKNLKDEGVDLHVIVSSTQVLRKDTRKDTWGEYSDQRDKLLNLIGDSPAQGIVLLSGDIHAAEISRFGDAEEAAYFIDFPLYEITASGLNRLRRFYNWDNPYQEGFVKKHNFGEIDIAKSDDGTLRLVARLRSPESPEGEVLLQKIIQYAPR
jgi:alkaline phosphatase D